MRINLRNLFNVTDTSIITQLFIKHYIIISFALILSNVSVLAQTGIIACYPFDGSANDNSGNGFHANIIGPSLIQNRYGIPSSAYTFDGVNDFMVIDHDSLLNFDVNEDFSISFWIKFQFNQNDLSLISNDIISKWEDNATGDQQYPFRVSVVNQSAPAPYVNGSILVSQEDSCSNMIEAQSTVFLNNNTFHHIILIKDSNQLYLYVDNNLNQTMVDSTTCYTENNYDIFIGRRAGNQNAHYFQGAIDELVIFNYAIDQTVRDCLHNVPAQDLPCGCDDYYAPYDSSDTTPPPDTIPGDPQEEITCKAIFPNIITPNNDNRNDTFMIIEYIDTCTVDRIYIYNRWGQLIHKSQAGYWDGRNSEKEPVTPGTYYYVIHYRESDDISNGYVLINY